MIKTVNNKNLIPALVAASATDFLVDLRFDLIQQGEKARTNMKTAGQLLHISREIIMADAKCGNFAGLTDSFALYEHARVMMRTAAKRYAACEKARQVIENVAWPYTSDTVPIVQKTVNKIMNY